MSHTYHTNNNIVFLCRYHVIFSPKYRAAILEGKIATELERLILEQATKYNVGLIEHAVMPDHVHILVDIDPQFGICRFVKQLKGYTSRLLRWQFPKLLKMPSLWTNSYFVTTLSDIETQAVTKYIKSQKLKHK